MRIQVKVVSLESLKMEQNISFISTEANSLFHHAEKLLFSNPFWNVTGLLSACLSWPLQPDWKYTQTCCTARPGVWYVDCKVMKMEWNICVNNHQVKYYSFVSLSNWSCPCLSMPAWSAEVLWPDVAVTPSFLSWLPLVPQFGLTLAFTLVLQVIPEVLKLDKLFKINW